MIRLFLVLATFLFAEVTAIAQTDKYTQGMEKAFALWGENKPNEAVNLFERIAGAEKDNWIPYYYAANVNIITGFSVKDQEALGLLLEKAQKHLDKAKELSPNNPELMVMQALLYTVWVAFDGATYGMKYGQTVAGIYEKAYVVAPDNPRVIFSRAEWNMGSARFFGQDIAPFCKDIKKAIELFATFKSEIPFYPSWGKDRAQQALEECK